MNLAESDSRLVEYYVKPAATLDALVPGFAYFAAWYLLGALAFWLIGMETRGRTIEEIDAQMSRGVAPDPRPARVAAE